MCSKNVILKIFIERCSQFTFMSADQGMDFFFINRYFGHNIQKTAASEILFLIKNFSSVVFASEVKLSSSETQ